jgi:hypothetical protein
MHVKRRTRGPFGNGLGNAGGGLDVLAWMGASKVRQQKG